MTNLSGPLIQIKRLAGGPWKKLPFQLKEERNHDEEAGLGVLHRWRAYRMRW
jgi:hypothetical protein